MMSSSFSYFFLFLGWRFVALFPLLCHVSLYPSLPFDVLILRATVLFWCLVVYVLRITRAEEAPDLRMEVSWRVGWSGGVRYCVFLGLKATERAFLFARMVGWCWWFGVTTGWMLWELIFELLFVINIYIMDSWSVWNTKFFGYFRLTKTSLLIMFSHPCFNSLIFPIT